MVTLADPRIKKMADILVNHSIKVQPGEQILIRSTPLAKPLLEEVYRSVLRSGGSPVILWSSENFQRIFYEEASEEQLTNIPEIMRYQYEHADGLIVIDAPENGRELTGIDPALLAEHRKVRIPMMERYYRNEAKWVLTAFPTSSLAQDANMSLDAFEDFIYRAVNIDWKELAQTMKRAANRFDMAREVHIKAPGTDIKLSIEGRKGIIDSGENNMPGGEFFYAPLEHKTEGVITYEWPTVLSGHEVSGIRLHFQEGKVVEASADKGEDYLRKMLDTDEGARYLGELGIGCNEGIQQHTKNILFDEKIGGTVHLALGMAYKECGGTNESALHWDMIKDLRSGGEIYLDGQLVQKDGKWTF